LNGATGAAGGPGTGVAGASDAGSTGGAGGQAGSPPMLTYVGSTSLPILDLLFVVDNGPGTGTAQEKLVAQVPALLQALQAQVGPSLDLHVGVVSTDLGAPGDSLGDLNCTASGDGGLLQTSPRLGCTASPVTGTEPYLVLSPGAQNFSGTLSDALTCILPLGQSGCGFKQTLSSMAKALGAYTNVAPAANGRFLRDGFFLAIVILTTEDDCSAQPGDTQLYSLNGGAQSLSNPLGPLTTYRCNRYGHLCTDPATGQTGVMPPLEPPADAVGAPPSLALTSCVSNDSADTLTEVSALVAAVRTLEQRPDDHIFVGSIVAPASPYGIAWETPPAGATTPDHQSELWPSVLHSCGPTGGDGVNPSATQTTTDGSFGDPAVRITQFAESFPRHAVASVCDASFATSMTAFGTAIGLMTASTLCVPDGTPVDSQGQPLCAVNAATPGGRITPLEKPVPNCDVPGGASPCWTALAPDPAACAGTAGSRRFSFSPAPDGVNIYGYSVNCASP
jgi:hypothetical protein